ncbi:MAG: hypothetical protein A4E49_02770 [Methanosaeta sp. PtaU1.Bin112]|nr:MAG: hypothetical protein A4E49_02770 [Methanosaeta sp. PtaU1.Bin112]
MGNKLENASRSSIDIKDSYEFYVLALKELNKSNEQDAFIYYDRANHELIAAINNNKWSVNGYRIHSPRTISYSFKNSGLYSIIYSVIFTMCFVYLTYHYGDLKIQNVPLWSAFYSGFGAYSYILGSSIKKFYQNGIIENDKSGWFVTIPVLCMISGYMVYLIFNNSIGNESVDRVSITILICFLAGSITCWYLLKEGTNIHL